MLGVLPTRAYRPGTPGATTFLSPLSGTFNYRRDSFQWHREYNTVRPHSSLGYLPPASEAIRPDPKLLNLPLLLGPRPRQNEAVGLTL